MYIMMFIQYIHIFLLVVYTCIHVFLYIPPYLALNLSHFSIFDLYPTTPPPSLPLSLSHSSLPFPLSFHHFHASPSPPPSIPFQELLRTVYSDTSPLKDAGKTTYM